LKNIRILSNNKKIKNHQIEKNGNLDTMKNIPYQKYLKMFQMMLIMILMKN